MFELLKEINWNLIGTLVLVSALVAWVGDIVGMKLGKKRITFMNLRPKHTSRIISVLTGVGIAMITLFAISAASEPVRTALFSMNYVQNQINSLTAELQKNRGSLQDMELELFASRGDLSEKQLELQIVEEKLADGTKNLKTAKAKLLAMEAQMAFAEKEQNTLIKLNEKLEQDSKKLSASVSEMQRESEKLKEGIQRLREGRIAALTGEVLSQGVVDNTTITPYYAEQIIDRLKDEACALLAYRFGKKKEDIKPPVLDEKSSAAVKKNIVSDSSARWLLRMTAQSNAVEGEPVMVRVDSFRTKRIYNAGEVLYECPVKAGTPRVELEETVFRALKDLNAKAAREGVMREPLTGNIGSVDTAELMNTLEAFDDSKTDKTLRIVTANDIYSEGPLRIRVLIDNKTKK